MFVKAWDEYLWLILCIQDKAGKRGVGILRKKSTHCLRIQQLLSDPVMSTDAAVMATVFQFKAGLLLRKMVYPLILLLPVPVSCRSWAQRGCDLVFTQNQKVFYFPVLWILVLAQERPQEQVIVKEDRT